jgi:hypothetical protein
MESEIGERGILKGKGLFRRERSDWRFGGLEAGHDSLPFDFGVLKIDEQAEAVVGGSQVVEALRGVGGGEAVHAFDFDYQEIFDKDVGEILADEVAFVGDRQGSLGGGFDAAED